MKWVVIMTWLNLSPAMSVQMPLGFPTEDACREAIFDKSDSEVLFSCLEGIPISGDVSKARMTQFFRKYGRHEDHK